MFVGAGVAEPTSANPALVPSAVFWAQTLCAGACLPLSLLVLLLFPGADLRLVELGVGAAVAAWLAAALVPWDAISTGWQRLLPVINMAAILLFAAALPVPGLEWLLVVPVVWMATLGDRNRIWLAPLTATAALWTSMAWQFGLPDWAERGDQMIAGLMLPVVLAFVTGAVDVTLRRAVAPQVLLERQRVWTETALEVARLEREGIRATLDAVGFSVVRLAPDGTMITQNAATHRLIAELGFSAGTSLLSLPVYDEDGVTTLTHAKSPFHRALRGERVDGQVVWLGHPGQTRFAFEVTAQMTTEEDGPEQSVLIVSRDVTAEIESVRARDDLIASLSHELRTPLQTVSGYLELAQEAPELTTGTSDLLRVAMGGASRMQALVHDFLYAHLRSPDHAVVLNETACDLSRLAREAVSEIAATAHERLIGLHLQARSAGRLWGDPVRLRQVADILLSNAIKYTDFGGRVDVLIEQCRHQGQDAVRLTVTDTGRGMTEREQQGLFQPFYRAESVRRSKVHGTGLGLSIARDIIEQHRGAIALTSRAGEGTSVAVTLPVRSLAAGGEA